MPEETEDWELNLFADNSMAYEVGITIDEAMFKKFFYWSSLSHCLHKNAAEILLQFTLGSVIISKEKLEHMLACAARWENSVTY